VKKRKSISRVLELRALKKENAELEVARARNRLGAEEEKLASIDRTLAETVRMLQGDGEGSVIRVHEFELFQNYCLHLGDRLEAQMVEKQRSETELLRRQEALVEAHREKKLIETLLERLAREKEKEAGVLEQKDADSLYLTRRPPTK
jgi:flagellar export protein FliJ